MTSDVEEAKGWLDQIINKARVDLYKPIQIAEVLRESRWGGGIDILNLEEYKNPSVHWRNRVTEELSGKRPTSSANYQHAVRSEMPAEALQALDAENKDTGGVVERYVYMKYQERQGTVAEIIAVVDEATPEEFRLEDLLELFEARAGIRRSVDKAYEIVVHSLFETVVIALEATVKVSVPESNRPLLEEFSELAKVLLGVETGSMEWEQPAHVYRVGVTNAADRGLDMWANFGPAVQVKHLSLNRRIAVEIVDQVESDNIVIVCRDSDKDTIETITKQIGWGRRVRGMVDESQLAQWYELSLRGRFSDRLAWPLIEQLREGFRAEFPQTATMAEFFERRGYLHLNPPDFWRTEEEKEGGA